MPKPVALTPDLLEPYFRGKKRHSGYNKSVEEYEALRVHVDGELPTKLIKERRPHESPLVQDYREKIYEPITYVTTNRVLNSLTKIRRSPDWKIDYKNDKYPASLPQEERMEAYTDEAFPITETFDNWLFTVCFKSYLTDPNSIILIRPIETDIASNEFLQPFPWIYHSPQILEFIPNKLLIIQLEDDTEEDDQETDKKHPSRYLVVNTEVIERWVEKNDGGYTIEKSYKHGLGRLPAFKAGGSFYKYIGRNILLRSRLYPMLPRLNDAAREYSDMQAEVVLHMHSEKWQWATTPCAKCVDGNGISTGFIKRETKSAPITCPECKGSKKTVSQSPYSVIVVRPSKESMGEQAAPNPPGGYITKDTAIVKIQDERIDKHLYNALAALNMQFLDQTPLNISGKGKEVDKEELNNFVYSIAEDLVRIAKKSNSIMIDYRYRKVIQSPQKRKELIPIPSVPERYDLLISSSYIAMDIKEAKEATVNSAITAALEVEYADKKFYNDEAVRRRVKAILMLDPLLGLTEDEKMTRLNTHGITRLSYVISSNVASFVDKATNEKPNFYEMKLKEQAEIMVEYGQALIEEMDKDLIEVPTDPEGEPPVEE